MGALAKCVSCESDLLRFCAAQHAAGRRIVLTNGCFDVLHWGHARYLAEARALGDCLLVGVNSDVSVRALKGPGRPVQTEAHRAYLIASLESVTAVYVFPEDDAARLITLVRPSILAKGGDYSIGQINRQDLAAARAVGAEVRILCHEPGLSTSRVLHSALHCAR